MQILREASCESDSKDRYDEIRKRPIFDHGIKIGLLIERSNNLSLSKGVREESHQEVLRYRDEGLALIEEKNMVSRNKTYMTKSGFCAHPSEGSHHRCKDLKCTCDCHTKEKVYSGKGIIFAVIDDREQMREGNPTTIDIISEAIEEALDNGYEDSHEIARYITTNAFQHVRDRRVRFNSVLKASDLVGAQIVRKLINSYNELQTMADEAPSPKDKKLLTSEATGFAEAVQIVLNPFSSEDKGDPRLVDWDEVAHMTDLFIKEQRAANKEQNGNPQ